MTPVGVFFIYPNEDKLGFVNSAILGRIIFKSAVNKKLIPIFSFNRPR